MWFIFLITQAHAEYSRRVKEADMLEAHIIQARARAAATEKQAYENMKEMMGDVSDHQGLPTGEMETVSWIHLMCSISTFKYIRGILLCSYPLCLCAVKSAFSWCVDNDLLKMNNLISPQDYLPAHKPQVQPPAPST